MNNLSKKKVITKENDQNEPDQEKENLKKRLRVAETYLKTLLYKKRERNTFATLYRIHQHRARNSLKKENEKLILKLKTLNELIGSVWNNFNENNKILDEITMNRNESNQNVTQVIPDVISKQIHTQDINALPVKTDTSLTPMSNRNFKIKNVKITLPRIDLNQITIQSINSSAENSSQKTLNSKFRNKIRKMKYLTKLALPQNVNEKIWTDFKNKGILTPGKLNLAQKAEINSICQPFKSYLSSNGNNTLMQSIYSTQTHICIREICRKLGCKGAWLFKINLNERNVLIYYNEKCQHAFL